MFYSGPGSSFAGDSHTIRVLLVEDNSIFLAYLSGMLARNPAVAILGHAQDGIQAVRSTFESKPDVVLLDIGLPRMNGIEVAKRITASVPTCKIIFLTQEGSPEFVEAAFEVGAAAYVLKTHANKDLWMAIVSVCEGRQFLSSGLKQPAKLGSGLQQFVVS